MQRTGWGNQQGLIFVLNTSNQWSGTKVNTKWNNRKLVPAAWRGKDNTDTPMPIITDNNGSADCWAPPRGYAVYILG